MIPTVVLLPRCPSASELAPPSLCRLSWNLLGDEVAAELAQVLPQMEQLKRVEYDTLGWGVQKGPSSQISPEVTGLSLPPRNLSSVLKHSGWSQVPANLSSSHAQAISLSTVPTGVRVQCYMLTM